MLLRSIDNEFKVNRQRITLFLLFKTNQELLFMMRSTNWADRCIQQWKPRLDSSLGTGLFMVYTVLHLCRHYYTVKG